MMFVIILFLAIQLSSEECSNKKEVSITIDLVEDTIASPQGSSSAQLLWHVAVLQQEEKGVKFLCSGTIVDRHHVLTAASCVLNVGINDLRVVSGLTLVRKPYNMLVNPHSVFTVVKKYYNFHRGNLAILKLEHGTSSFIAPRLAALNASIKSSKQCFALGWGMNNQSSQTSRCRNPSFQDSINSIDKQSGLDKPILNKILQVYNFMGRFSGMFIHQLSKVFDIISGFQFYGSNSKQPLHGMSCSVDEFTRVKAVRMTTKHPYNCLCHNTNHICLYSQSTDDIVQQVDMGSPVFCKLKRPKATSTSPQIASKFVLAGIVTNKGTEEIRWLKYKSTIKMMRATNITIFTDFILAVMFDKN